jgi:hypothetical protein
LIGWGVLFLVFDWMRGKFFFFGLAAFGWTVFWALLVDWVTRKALGLRPIMPVLRAYSVVKVRWPGEQVGTMSRWLQDRS